MLVALLSGAALGSTGLAAGAPADAAAGRDTVAMARPESTYWFDGRVPSPDASEAIALLQAAPRHGLIAADYGAEALAAGFAAVRAAPGEISPRRIAQLDAALTNAFVRYLADLHDGRSEVPTRRVAGLPPPRAFDPASMLRDARTAHRLGAAVETAEPALPIYGRLVELLARYRELSALPWPPLPALPQGVTKRVTGDRYAGSVALQDRLLALGDLESPIAAVGDDVLSVPLTAALMRFQARHGLDGDGVLGKATLAALNVTPAVRVHQLELSLERLRRLPDLAPGPVVAVNIPSYRLWAFEHAPAAASPQNGAATAAQARGAPLTMPVIVGRAVRTPTPSFVGAMRWIEFNPFWNVPPSIQQKEIVPRLASDPGYLAREDMELVDTGGRGPPLATVDAMTLGRLREGTLRIRQRPGPRNALDGIKFVLPNTMDIYLHGTPANALFTRGRRDFSHGCIRLADPNALAAFVLADQRDWTPERIAAAVAAGATSTVRLTAPIPVVIFYATAIADAAGHAVFLSDVYGEDAKLAAALRERSRRAAALVAQALR